MKAQPNIILPITHRDLNDSMSYFNADDIRKIGLSPFQALGSLSGIRRGSTQVRQMRTAKYNRDSAPIVLNKAETGLTIEKNQPIRDSFVTLGASTAAFAALIQTRALNAGKVIQHNVVNYQSFIYRS